MNTEIISRVEILDSGELILILESGGDAEYQHIYREAAEVYWDKSLKGFKSSVTREWSCLKALLHIVSIAKKCSISLELSPKVTFKNIPVGIQEEILTHANT